MLKQRSSGRTNRTVKMPRRRGTLDDSAPHASRGRRTPYIIRDPKQKARSFSSIHWRMCQERREVKGEGDENESLSSFPAESIPQNGSEGGHLTLINLHFWPPGPFLSPSSDSLLVAHCGKGCIMASDATDAVS